jgi:putative hemolysin
MNRHTNSQFRVKLADTPNELIAAKRLRYDVFVRELGAGGALVDHSRALEQDRFDPHVDHMIVTDSNTGSVVGAYRLLRAVQADAAGGFYSEDEYDLSKLRRTGKRLLELGRSCLHPDYRGGTALHALWSGLAGYVADHKIEILFGVASFHGTDTTRIAAPLSMLHHRHLAPSALRVRARAHSYQRMDLVHEDMLDRRAAMIEVPSLIKAYLRLGGFVGEGAFVDHTFNTTDVCLVMDTAQLNSRRARIIGAQHP